MDISDLLLRNTDESSSYHSNQQWTTTIDQVCTLVNSFSLLVNSECAHAWLTSIWIAFHSQLLWWFMVCWVAELWGKKSRANEFKRLRGRRVYVPVCACAYEYDYLIKAVTQQCLLVMYMPACPGPEPRGQQYWWLFGRSFARKWLLCTHIPTVVTLHHRQQHQWGPPDRLHRQSTPDLLQCLSSLQHTGFLSASICGESDWSQWKKVWCFHRSRYDKISNGKCSITDLELNCEHKCQVKQWDEEGWPGHPLQPG